MIKKTEDNYSFIYGLSILLVFKFYFFRRSFYYSNFDVTNLFLQISILLILNLIIIWLFFLLYKRTYNFKFLNNFILSIFVVLLSVYVIKTFFYLSNITTLSNFLIENIFKEIKINYLLSRLLAFLVPYIFCFFIIFFLKKEIKMKIIRFYSILGFMFLLIFTFDMSKNLYSKITKNNLQDIFKPYEFEVFDSPNNRKVIWILFDAFDPQIGFDEGQINLKNFNKLRDNSIYFSNSYSPSNRSLYSMTANLIGSKINRLIVRGNFIEISDKNNNFIKFINDNTIFGRLDQNNLTSKIISSTLDYCSSLNHKNCKAKKYQSQALTDNATTGIKITYPIISQLKLFVKIFDKKPLDYKINNINNFNKENGIENYSEKLDQIDDIDGMEISKFSDIQNFINSEDSLLFMHLNLPHLPSTYIENILELTTSNEYEQFFLNTLYADYVLGRIINIINNSKKNEIMLVLNSDHWQSFSDEELFQPKKVLQIVKNFEDDKKSILDKKTSTIYLQELIHKYLIGELNSNNEISEFYSTKKFIPVLLAEENP